MLTLQFIPHGEIENLDSKKRISKIMRLVKEDKIVLLEGRLKSFEEAELISQTMEEINSKFKGIELSVINPESSDTDDLWQKIKHTFRKILLGDREGFTIIGPASIVKEIKNDPEKIQLFTTDGSKKKR